MPFLKLRLNFLEFILNIKIILWIQEGRKQYFTKNLISKALLSSKSCQNRSYGCFWTRSVLAFNIYCTLYFWKIYLDSTPKLFLTGPCKCGCNCNLILSKWLLTPTKILSTILIFRLCAHIFEIIWHTNFNLLRVPCLNRALALVDWCYVHTLGGNTDSVYLLIKKCV